MSIIEDEDVMQFQLSEADTKLTDWKNEPSLMLLKGDLESSKQEHDALVSKIREWTDLRAVEGSARPKKISGRSSVQPKLIRRQAEWRYSALSEPFLSSDKLFKVSPITHEDVAAARQNELLLNHQFRTKIDRVTFIDSLVRSQVDDGTAFVRVGWKFASTMVKEHVPVFEHYPIETEEQAVALQQALELKIADPRTYNEKLSPEVHAAVDYYEANGQANYAIQVGTEEIEKEKILENRPTVELVDPSNIYIDPSCN